MFTYKTHHRVYHIKRSFTLKLLFVINGEQFSNSGSEINLSSAIDEPEANFRRRIIVVEQSPSSQNSPKPLSNAET